MKRYEITEILPLHYGCSNGRSSDGTAILLSGRICLSAICRDIGNLFEIKRDAERLIHVAHDFAAQLAEMPYELCSRHGVQLSCQHNTVCCQACFRRVNRYIAGIN